MGAIVLACRAIMGVDSGHMIGVSAGRVRRGCRVEESVSRDA